MHHEILNAVARDIIDARVREAEQVRAVRQAARSQRTSRPGGRRRLARRIGIGIPLVVRH
jgi:hypothetical protein